MPQVTSADGTTIGYETHGSGPLVVFVSGATQYRALDHETPGLVTILAQKFTVLLYDRRGRGESGNTEPYAIAREVEDIEAVINAQGDTAMLYGMSSGALLAIEAAAALPEKVSRVACYEPPVNVDQPREEAFAEVAKMEGFKARGDGAGAMSAFMTSIGTPPEQVEGFKASPAWPAFAAVGTTIAHDMRIVAETSKDDMKARWRGVSQPVLVINGDASFAFMAPGADAVAAALANASRHTLPGQDHGPDPEVIAPVLLDFLSGTPGGRS